MKKETLILLLTALIIVVALVFVWSRSQVADTPQNGEVNTNVNINTNEPAEPTEPTEPAEPEEPITYDDSVIVNDLQPGDVVTSPLTITGEARGPWYFEASFSIHLFDGNGNEIGVGIAQAVGEWMTTEFVPFESNIEFETPETPEGMLVFEKANASGLPEHADSFSLPVRFISQ